jgi:dipeptidyl-peptidase-4
VPAGRSAPLAIDDYAWSKDGNKVLVYTNSERVWRQNTRGDYWVYDRKAGTLAKLGGDADAALLMFAKFSPDGTRVGYVRQNNLYVENLADHDITPLTHDGSGKLINGTFDWVYEEELFLRDGWRWSPDGRSIAYWQINTDGVGEMTLVNNTEALYPVVTRFAYPKAGQTNSAARIGVVSTTGGETRWLDIPGDPRNHYLARMDWAANSDELVVQQLNRLQNANHVLLGDARTGQVRTLLVERDGAWVDVYENDLHWLDKGKAFTWLSERDGWRHIYVVARDGGDVRRVTAGDFDVIQIEKVDEAEGWVYYLASPDNPTQRYLYRSRLDGSGSPERLTPKDEPGTHEYDLAPNARWALRTHSTFTTPPHTELVRLPGHEIVRTVAAQEALHRKVAALRCGPSEFFRVGVGDGVQLDGWVIKPPDFEPGKRYPILFYVYGEPWSQTVVDRWDGSTYLWHRLLAQQGYLVASVDNRGTSAPRGRAWRKVVYRKLGVLPAAEQAAAVRAVAVRPYVDRNRIAVWGWSGGGSMSLNAIFRYPDLYHTAMAVAPMADMRYYDTIYQERYMGLPQENADDYKKGSPITYAGRLKGNLLIVHGTGDDNVHYQATEALANALIAANKPFTLMPYPNRTHAIAEGPNTRRHLFGLLTRYLKDHMPGGPR